MNNSFENITLVIFEIIMLNGKVLLKAFIWVFLLGVLETIVGYLLCCVVGIVQCLLNLLFYVIW